MTEDKKLKWASLVLRIGVSFVFLYVVFHFFLYPDGWSAYFPAWAKAIIPEPVLSYGFALYEIIMAFLILFDKKTFYTALLATLTLSLIIIFNLDSFNILFRNVAIISATLALVIINRK